MKQEDLPPQIWVCVSFSIPYRMFTKFCEANLHLYNRIPGVPYTLQSTEQELNQHSVLIY